MNRGPLRRDLGFDGAWGFDHFQPLYGEGPGERLDDPAAAAGRDPAAILRATSLSLDDLDAARRQAAQWRDAGYGYLVCDWPDAGRSQVEAFARAVMAELA